MKVSLGIDRVSSRMRACILNDEGVRENLKWKLFKMERQNQSECFQRKTSRNAKFDKWCPEMEIECLSVKCVLIDAC